MNVQVACCGITEAYLSDFRLVWRSLLQHLRSVFDNAWMLACIRPEVVVDALRAAQLIDEVLQVPLAILTATMLHDRQTECIAPGRCCSGHRL